VWIYIRLALLISCKRVRTYECSVFTSTILTTGHETTARLDVEYRYTANFLRMRTKNQYYSTTFPHPPPHHHRLILGETTLLFVTPRPNPCLQPAQYL